VCIIFSSKTPIMDSKRYRVRKRVKGVKITSSDLYDKLRETREAFLCRIAASQQARAFSS
jgi:hypothetical protein